MAGPVAALAFAGALGGSPAWAADGFAPKSVTIIVASAPGGGTDTTARLAGRYLAKYLPGQPAVIYLNIPGAGGIKGVNDFVVKYKPDGLTSVAGSASHIDPTTLKNAAVQYDPKELRMYGGFPAQDSILSIRKDALPRFKDKSQPPVVMGEVYSARHADQIAAWGPIYLGWNVRWVLGYKGTAELTLAAIRGEVDMMCTYDTGLLDQLKESGLFVPAMQIGVLKGGKFVAGEDYADVPVFSDLMRPVLKDPEAIKAFAAWEALSEIAKWLALPPKTPEDILQIYPDAFDKAVADDAFPVDAAKVLGEHYTISSGEEMQQVAFIADNITDRELTFFDDLKEKVGVHVAK